MHLLAGPWLEMSESDCVDQYDGEARVGQAERSDREWKSMEVKLEQKRERRRRVQLAGTNLVIH
jgi:hypothetical protein